jgi:predicted glycosyltransferase
VRVWIDLSNSPHPLLFAPVTRRLEELGHEVRVSVRDNAQTLELARERWPEAVCIGGPAPSGRPAKARAVAERVTALRSWAKAQRVDVALSHNSYAQLAAARALRLPAVTAMDYEHQPANHLGFRLASAVLLPEALREAVVRRQGARPRKTVRYAGLKEELYLGDFRLDGGVLDALGVERPPGGAIVVARTPPTGASYHRFDNPLFIDSLQTLARQPRVHTVVLARRAEQRRALEQLSLPNLTVPGRAVDSRSLMAAADLVIGAGGTMTREAALLGVPTFSLFAGEPAAVDSYLEQRGLLRRLTDSRQLAEIRPRDPAAFSVQRLRERAAPIVETFVTVTLQAGARGMSRPPPARRRRG